MFGMEIKDLAIYAGAGLGGLIALLILLKAFSGGKKKPHEDLERGQREILDDYPAAPPTKGGRRLVFDGVDVRLRLVVVAPVGTQKEPIDVDDVPELLNDLLRGLGAFCLSDKPRIRVWPAQLSVVGFAPTFFRLVESPDAVGQKSHWIRVAGPIKIGGVPHLLGLALHADETTKLGGVDLEAMAWSRHLQIEK